MPKSNNSGGKRYGSGRKVKKMTTAVEVAKEIDYDLSDAQVAAVAMLARGLKQKKIAKELDIAEGTLCSWKRLPEFKRAQLDMRAKILSDPMVGIDPLVSKAFGALDDALEADDVGLRAKVADSVLDRKYGKAIVRQANASVVDVNITIKSNEDADLSPYIEADDGPEDFIEGEFTEQVID